MTVFIFIALLNGCCIALSRILNGQLAAYRGAFNASYMNHIAGFLFLSVVLLFLTEPPKLADNANLFIYLGGFIGAFYVAINSLVMTQLGSTNSIVLVISGQMLFGLFLDSSNSSISEMLLKLLGVLMIVSGIYFKEVIKHKRSDS